MSETLISDLKAQIAGGNVAIVVGSGVSSSVTNNHACASWIGLLHDGVKRCMDVVRGLPTGWDELVQKEIDSGDLDDLLSAAQKICSKLNAPTGAEYSLWLRQSVGTLKAVNPDILNALKELDCIYLTTNYDSLIEEVTGLPSVTWMDGNAIERVVRGDDRGVVHLHGTWQRPESIILGISSYERVLGNAHAQNIERAVQTMKTLLFVGCGDGMRDPNVGKLMEWTRAVLFRSEYRRFCLTRESEVDKLQEAHPQDERLFILSYGSKFDDLAPFLRSLGCRRRIKDSQSKSIISVALPSRPPCFGRDSEIELIVLNLLGDRPQPLPVLGSPGIGKSTLTIAALHHEKIVGKYGSRRYFVRCDAIKSRVELSSAIAQKLGLTPSPTIEPEMIVELKRDCVVLVLDNAEIPWEHDTLAVEELLGLLAEIPKLALIITLRGLARPANVMWRESVEAKALKLLAARETFLATAGKLFQSDPFLDQLLSAVDFVPLAITLLAHQAEGEPDLKGLWERWQTERTTMLRRADGRDRVTNIEVSYELSIQSSRLTEVSRRLLRILALLPDGLSHADISVAFPDHGIAAAAALRKTGLAFDDLGRTRLLSPLKDYVSRQHPPERIDQYSVLKHYLELTKLGLRVGGDTGAAAVKALTPETANIEAVLAIALEDKSTASVQAAINWGRFVRITGLGSTKPIEKARRIASEIASSELTADCLRTLGNIALRRYQQGTARESFREALPIYTELNDFIGQANCIQGLGEVALQLSENEAARASFQEALDLYKKVDNTLGQANCIKGLGEVALERSEYEVARAKFHEALPFYKQLGNLLGEANCIRSLGAIAMEYSDREGARAKFQEALPLYRQVGSPVGQANCLWSLGKLAMKYSDHEGAHAYFQQALALYRQVGNRLGECNCILSFGDLALANGCTLEARNYYESALTISESLTEGHSIGLAHCGLARLSTEAERESHIQFARAAWEKLDWPGLMVTLEAEFGKK